MGCLYLEEEEVAGLVDMPAALQALQGAFSAWSRGEVENQPRRRVRGHGCILHSMSASASYLHLAGWKQYTTTRSGARFMVGLYDTASGRPVAFMAANRLGQLRTGAATAVAAGYLRSSSMPVDIGMIGCGYQAAGQLEALAAEGCVRRADVYCRSSERREAFATSMTGKLHVEVRPAADARDAVANKGIVVTATNSRVPVVPHEWIAEGALVCAVGSNWPDRAELDVETVARAGRVVCDQVEACRVEAGELHSAAAAGRFDWADAQELRDFAEGPPPDPGSGRTVFKSVGLAIEDVALAAVVLERARDAGIGRVIFE